MNLYLLSLKFAQLELRRNGLKMGEIISIYTAHGSLLVANLLPTIFGSTRQTAKSLLPTDNTIVKSSTEKVPLPKYSPKLQKFFYICSTCTFAQPLVDLFILANYMYKLWNPYVKLKLLQTNIRICTSSKQLKVHINEDSIPLPYTL